MGVENNVKYQYLAGICVNIITISYGAFCGWTSGAFLELQSDNSPLETGPLTNDEMGWISSMLCIGGTAGTIFYAWCADRIGRKRCLQLTSLPSFLGWLIIPFARNPSHLALSRFLGGFGGGGAFVIIPIYTTELATDSIRGILGTFLILSCNLGILITFILAYFFNYIIVSWLLSVVSLIFLLTFSFLPETPQYLLKRNKSTEAKKSLMYYRGTRKVSAENFQAELEILKDNQKEIEDSTAVTCADFLDRKARKGFLISMTLMVLNQLSGCFALISYTATIFHQSGSHMTPTSAAIVVGAIQLLGSYVSTLLVERAGRKLLLILSSFCCGIGILTLGLYVYLRGLGYDTTAYGWVPVFGFSFGIFSACWGVLPMPYVVMSEILVSKIRDVASMICMIVLWAISIFLLKYMPTAVEFFGMHGVMFFFAGSCFAGTLFIAIFVPETKGKSLDAILASL